MEGRQHPTRYVVEQSKTNLSLQRETPSKQERNGAHNFELRSPNPIPLSPRS